jgi:hypothetical protein
MAQAPTATINFGSGMASQFAQGQHHVAETGPVIRAQSAWRGEATAKMPKRPRSQATVFKTLKSSSHAAQPPAQIGYLQGLPEKVLTSA